MSENEAINTDALPSGEGCADCLSGDGTGWWLHLRRCAQCGHIGCCDTSPSQHATKHYHQSGHPILRSFEPGEDWFYDYRSEAFVAGPELAGPQCHPLSQPVPGPAGAVPADWERHLNM